MAEIGTFSALVDDCIMRSGRKDRLVDIQGYARTTIRECTVLALFDQNLVEVQETVTTVPHIWKRPLLLRNVITFKYPYFDRRGEPIYPKELKPGKVKTSDQYYFYLSGNSYIFAGIAVGDVIAVAYSTYAPRFAYYATVSERPATFDDTTQVWSYTDAYDDSEILKQTAQDLVSNWLVFYWYDLLIEGVLAKVFKQMGDQRSKATYGLYKSMQKDLLAGESQVYVGHG